MKTIKFRAISKDTGKMIFGFMFYHFTGEKAYIKSNETGPMVFDLVDKKTIGQFTGVHDIKKNPIYAGDFLKVGENLIGFVEYIDRNVDDYGDEISAAFHFNIPSQEKTIPFDNYLLNNCTVIGNIHENSELCKII